MFNQFIQDKKNKYVIDFVFEFDIKNYKTKYADDEKNLNIQIKNKNQSKQPHKQLDARCG